jgi:SAM-dependent methyltransferase
VVCSEYDPLREQKRISEVSEDRGALQRFAYEALFLRPSETFVIQTRSDYAHADDESLGARFQPNMESSTAPAKEDRGPQMNLSEEKLARLSVCQTDLNDHSYLVYRTLFADLEKAASHATGALLDIGCGNKPYESMFKGRVTSYTGCDVVQSSQERVDILCAATAIPAPDASFNTILCTQVIEHVADHRALLHEAYRLLAPDGVLILSGPLYWPLHEEPHDYFRFTEYGLSYLLAKAGFEEMKITPNGGNWALCGQVLIHTLQRTPLRNRFARRLINYIFAALDDRFPDKTNTLNYVAVARKPAAAGVRL